jgi:hypothetical protein
MRGGRYKSLAQAVARHYHFAVCAPKKVGETALCANHALMVAPAVGIV